MNSPKIRHLSQDATRNMLGLADALQSGSERTFAALQTVALRLDEVLEHVDQIAAGVRRLARLALNGRVELASVPDADAIASLFVEVQQQVVDARARLGNSPRSNRPPATSEPQAVMKPCTSPLA